MIRGVSWILIFLMLVSCCNMCWADVVQPGTKEIGISYKIENINDYSDYVFLAHGIPNPLNDVITSSEFSFYKLSQVTIYAIKKSDYSKIDFSKMNDSEIENFFKNDKRVIPSNIKLAGSYGSVPDSNPLEDALMVLKIESINSNQLNLTKTEMVYYYDDGTSSMENFTDQKVIPKPENSMVSSNSIYLLIVLITVILLIMLVFKKRKNK